MGKRLNYVINGIGDHTSPCAVLFSNSHHSSEDPQVIFEAAARESNGPTSLVEKLLSMRYASDDGEHRKGDRMFWLDADQGDREAVSYATFDADGPEVTIRVMRVQVDDPKPEPEQGPGLRFVVDTESWHDVRPHLLMTLEQDGRHRAMAFSAYVPGLVSMIDAQMAAHPIQNAAAESGHGQIAEETLGGVVTSYQAKDGCFVVVFRSKDAEEAERARRAVSFSPDWAGYRQGLADGAQQVGAAESGDVAGVVGAQASSQSKGEGTC